jgi:hypothetical protein
MSDYSDLILASSPVGYWRLNETSGVTASDSSGGAHHGTYTNTYTLNQPGLVDQDTTSKSVDFDGSDGFVQLPASISAALHGSAAITLEGWILATSVASSSPAMTFSTGSNIGCRVALESPTTITFTGRSVAADAAQSDTVTVASILGNTVYAAIVCDYANDKLYGYINGIQVTDKVVTFANTTFTYVAGLFGAIGASSSGAQTMDGKMGDVAVFSSVLTPTVILSHYEAGAAQPENRHRAKSAIKGYYSIHHLGI